MSMLIRMFQLDCHAVIYEFHRAIDKGVHGLVVCPFHGAVAAFEIARPKDSGFGSCIRQWL